MDALGSSGALSSGVYRIRQLRNSDLGDSGGTANRRLRSGGAAPARGWSTFGSGCLAPRTNCKHHLLAVLRLNNRPPNNPNRFDFIFKRQMHNQGNEKQTSQVIMPKEGI